MTPFEAYQTYLALKMHFTSDYDYFKYSGKISHSATSFEKRKDKYFFLKLSKKPVNLIDFLVANFLEDPNTWVGELVSEQKYMDRYLAHVKRKESLSYLFGEEIDKLNDNLDELLKPKDGEHPELLVNFKRKEISAESIIIIDGILNIFKYWDAKIADDLFWPTIRKKLEKYKPFVKYDKGKFKKIMQKRFLSI